MKEMTPLKEGIVAILAEERTRNGSSIKKTLSADMSSNNWLQQNCFFSQVKKACSSCSSESEEECERNLSQDDVWRNIQQEKEKQKTEAWGSLNLIKHKSDNSGLPPYVHPLLKRPPVNMDEQSLDICTETLGSENGSKCSFYCSSCSSSLKEYQDKKDMKMLATAQVANSKKSVNKLFPPPLPSIYGRDGTILLMQSRRENGRLVLEGELQQPRNNFVVQRPNGRLVLSLVRPINTEEEVAEEQKGEASFASKKLNALPSETITIHSSVVKNPRVMTEAGKNFIIPKPLARSSVARVIPSSRSLMPSASFNAYEYFWGGNTIAISSGTQQTTLKKTKNIENSSTMKSKMKSNDNQDMVVTEGIKGEYLLPFLKGCKETRKSKLLWEPYCIPTS